MEKIYILCLCNFLKLKVTDIKFKFNDKSFHIRKIYLSEVSQSAALSDDECLNNLGNSNLRTTVDKGLE